MTEHTHLPIRVRMLPNGTDDESLAYHVYVCKGCRLILGDAPDEEN